MKVYRAIVFSRAASVALGQSGMGSQVSAVAMARSKSAFVDALDSVGLLTVSRSSILSETTETRAERHLAVCQNAGEVFIEPLTKRSDLTPWPSTDAPGEQGARA